jgi:hypothetical protein
MRSGLNLNFLYLSFYLVISGCSTAKLEARLEADPQCKPIINPKTGVLMPCPGSDRAFYAAVGLTPAKLDATSSGNQNSAPVEKPSAPIDCKPRIHQKTGGSLPCPTE